jgi:hypothetical protein
MIETAGIWASVVTLEGGIVYEGIIMREESHGAYLYIGGDESRLVLFPWSNVDRVIYKLK